MRAVRLAALALLGSVPPMTADALADALCGRGASSFEQLRDALARDAALKPSAAGGRDFVAYEEASPPRQWFVSRPDFPNVKAVVCRSLVQEGARFFVKTETRCFGPKPDCDKLSSAFQQQ